MFRTFRHETLILLMYLAAITIVALLLGSVVLGGYCTAIICLY